jgi:putative spermidine/putrescine transport system permease protein
MTDIAAPVVAAAAPRRAWHPRTGRVLGYAWLGGVMLFIYAPILVVVGASVDPGQAVGLSSFLQFPPRGFSLRWYFAISPELWGSLWFSIKLASLVAIASLTLGLPAALGLTRLAAPRFARLIDIIFRTPLQIPFIVTAVAFLQAYYALSDRFGIALQGTMTGLFLGHLFVATPYMIGSLVASLQRLDPRLEQAAMTLGAPHYRILLRVTLPLIASGLFGGLIYAFLMSFTDATIAIFLSGPAANPFPVWIVTSINQDLSPTVPAISTLVFFGSLTVVYLLQRLLGMDIIVKSGKNSR